jgi:hypothetical protein
MYITVPISSLFSSSYFSFIKVFKKVEMVRIIDTYVPVQGGAIFQTESDPEQNFCLSSGQAENQVRFYNRIIFNEALHMRSL